METRAGLEHLARLRRDEIDGFVEGLFGAEKSIDLPEKAHLALSQLWELRAMCEAMRRVASDESEPAIASEISGTLRHLHQLTRMAEDEMHAIILSCKRARRNMIAGRASPKPTLH
jgi:hypothetical protein